MKKLLVLAIFILFSLTLYAQPNSTQVRSDNQGNEGQILIHSGNFQGNQSIGTWQDIKLSSNNDFEFRYTEGSENKIENYGYFDYFPEVGAKNSLILQGYTQIFDFEYESNEPLTPVSYYGWRDDINQLHTDYVLTEEYEKYSNQYQDIRINQNKENILINSSAIKTNADNIINVDNKHTSWNKKQDKAIITNRDNIITNRDSIAKNSQRITNVENRVSDLEKTQYIVGFEGRVYDCRKWQVNVFADYTTTRNTFDRVGVRFTFKFGTSYEERRINELEEKLNELLERR